MARNATIQVKKIKIKGHQGQTLKNAQNVYKRQNKGQKKFDLQVKGKVKGHQGQILKNARNCQKRKNKV